MKRQALTVRKRPLIEIMYGGAVHSFTDWNAGSDPAQGVAYHVAADHRSWADMLQLFGEVF